MAGRQFLARGVNTEDVLALGRYGKNVIEWTPSTAHKPDPSAHFKGYRNLVERVRTCTVKIRVSDTEVRYDYHYKVEFDADWEVP